MKILKGGHINMIYTKSGINLSAINYMLETSLHLDGDMPINEDNLDVKMYKKPKRYIGLQFYTSGSDGRNTIVHGPRIKARISGNEATYAINRKTGVVMVDKSEVDTIPAGDKANILYTIQALAKIDLDLINDCYYGKVGSNRRTLLKGLINKYESMSAKDLRNLFEGE